MTAKKKRSGSPSVASEPTARALPRTGDLAASGLLVASSWSSLAALPLATGTNTGRVIAVLVVAAGWLAALALGWLSPTARDRRPFALALGGLAFAIALASAVSPYAARSLTWGSLSFFGAPLWIALAVITFAASGALVGDRWRGAVAASAAWVVPSLAIAAYQMASGEAVTGGFNTGNHFGSMMVAVFGVLAWLTATAEGTERRAWFGLAIGVSVGAIASRSSAALLGVLVAAAVAGLIAPGLFGSASSRGRATVRIAIWASAAVFATVVMAGVAAPQMLPERVATYVRGDVLGATFQTRVEMWKAAADVFKSRPLLGYGADSYHLAAQPHLSRKLFTLEHGAGLLAVPPDPHSLPMLFAAQFGVLGLIAGLAVLATWLRSVLATPEAEDASRALLRRAAGSSAIGFLVTMLFVPWAAVLGAFPAVVAGLAVAAPSRSAASERSPLAARLASAVGAVAFAALGVMLLSGVVALNAAENAPSAPEAQAAYDRMARALPTYPYARLMSLHAEGSQLGGSAEALAGWQQRVDADPEMRADATYALMLVRDALDQAYRWGRADVAWESKLLDDAAERFPNAPDLPLERAHAAVLAGDTAAAAALLDEAEKTAFGDTRLELYRYYVAVASGDTTAATRLRTELEAEYGPKALLDPQSATP